MSQNYSDPIENSDVFHIRNWGKWNKSWMILILPIWIVVSFYLSQIILIGAVLLLNVFHLQLSHFNESVVNSVLTASAYLITLILVGLMPIFIKNYRINRSDVGLTRLPSWLDIIITPAGLIIYMILSSSLILLFAHLFTWVDIGQVQDTGFNHLNRYYEYILAFVTLVVIAPLAEEILFRGYLYGKLKTFVPFWAAMIAVSAIFGAIHGAWDLAIDVFALSMVLCVLRELTGSLWASILLHMTKNGIAFYILFIYPLILATLGR
jgi:hypothetical protein